MEDFHFTTQKHYNISYTKRCIIVMGLVITVKARFGTYFEYYWSFHEKIEILEFEYEF